MTDDHGNYPLDVGSIQIDDRLGGTPRYFVGRADHLMQVPDEVRQSVVFILADTADGLQLAGTGFLISLKPEDELINGAFVYVVTAKHVLFDVKAVSVDRQVHLRINRKEGQPLTIGTPLDNWETHPTDPSVDAAVLPITPSNELDFKFIPITMAVTDAVVEEHMIGVGDEVYLTGLFVNHFGNNRNLPIVRTGTIALMPEEKVHTKDLGDIDAYLIEARSIGGLSGSPVFVYLGALRSLPDGVTEDGRTKHAIRYSNTGAPQYYWLGLMHGHWDIERDAVDAVIDRVKQEAVNMGIAIVVPATKILEVINKESLMKIRKDAELAAKAKRAPVADNALTKAGFETALKKVSKKAKPSPPAQEKKQTRKPAERKPAERKPTASDRLRAFLAEHPNACAEYTLTDIGAEIGVTRERVRQIMPDYSKRAVEARRRRRIAQNSARLAAFLEERPKAILKKSFGGMSYPDMAKAIGVSHAHLLEAWKAMGLPPKGIVRKTKKERSHESYMRHREAHKLLVMRWQQAHPERLKEIRRRAQQKWEAKVLRVETCPACGKQFDWTNRIEKSFRRGYRRSLACSISCGMKMRAV